MKKVKRISAALVGFVLLGSGLLKMLDPVGTGLLVKEYLSFFHLGFLQGASKGLGILLSLTEGVTGVALITGVRRKLTAWVTAVLLGFFTLVTLLLWIVNPPMHCGCFGEAIHLSHGESLVKNLILLALAALAFLPKTQDVEVPARKKAAFWIAAVSLVFALWYNARHLPLLDFTVYAPGTELYASLDNPYQAQDGLVTTYIYEKDGQTGSFTPVSPSTMPKGCTRMSAPSSGRSSSSRCTIPKKWIGNGLRDSMKQPGGPEPRPSWSSAALQKTWTASASRPSWKSSMPIRRNS